jgi:hypothetical protein
MQEVRENARQPPIGAATMPSGFIRWGAQMWLFWRRPAMARDPGPMRCGRQFSLRMVEAVNLDDVYGSPLLDLFSSSRSQ